MMLGGGMTIPHVIDFVPPVPPSTPVAELEDSLRSRRTQLVEQRAQINDKIAEIDEWLREIEAERAEHASAPAEWWYPA